MFQAPLELVTSRANNSLHSSGTLANVVGGFNFVGVAAAASGENYKLPMCDLDLIVCLAGRPSLASASLGGGASTAIDDSVVALTNAGISVVVAAGKR